MGEVPGRGLSAQAASVGYMHLPERNIESAFLPKKCRIYAVHTLSRTAMIHDTEGLFRVEYRVLNVLWFPDLADKLKKRWLVCAFIKKKAGHRWIETIHIGIVAGVLCVVYLRRMM